MRPSGVGSIVTVTIGGSVPAMLKNVSGAALQVPPGETVVIKAMGLGTSALVRNEKRAAGDITSKSNCMGEPLY